MVYDDSFVSLGALSAVFGTATLCMAVVLACLCYTIEMHYTARQSMKEKLELLIQRHQQVGHERKEI